MYACFEKYTHYSGWLTKLRQIGTIKNFMETFEKLAICKENLIDSFYE